MNVRIDEKGTLIATPQTAQEEFALKAWHGEGLQPKDPMLIVFGLEYDEDGNATGRRLPITVGS